MSSKDILDQTICWSKIRQDRLSFMSIGVFSIYDKLLLPFSPNTFIFVRCIFRARDKIIRKKIKIKIPQKNTFNYHLIFPVMQIIGSG